MNYMRTVHKAEHAVSALNIEVSEICPKKVPVWYVENQDTDLVCVVVTFRNTGFAYDRIPGAIDFLTSMMLEGTNQRDSEEFRNYLLNNRIKLSVSSDKDNVYITVKTVRQKLEKAAIVVKDILSDLKLAADDIERVRIEKAENLRESKNFPDAIARDRFNQFAFGKHAYFASIDETINGIANVTEAVLRDTLKRFAKEKMMAVFAGNVNEDDVEKFIEKVLQGIPEEAIAHQTVTDVVFHNQSKVEHVKKDIPQSVLRFGMEGLNRLHPDYYKFFILNEVFGGSNFHSRLFKVIRDKGGQAYHIGTGIFLSNHLNALIGSGGVLPENVDNVIDMTKTILKEMQENGITEEELAFQKQYQTGELALAFDSLMGTAFALAELQLNGLTPKFIKEWPHIIEALTLEDIRQAAKKYLDPDKLVFIVVGQDNDTVAVNH